MTEATTNVPAPAANVLLESGVPTIISMGEPTPEISPAAVATPAPTLPGVNVMNGDLPLHTISILTENTPGILARVAHVFARRGFNVESLAVSRTEDPTVSRMTVVVAGDDEAFTQMGKQLMKLIDVIKVIDHTRDELVGRELALIKVKANSTNRAEVMQIAEAFRANIVDVSPDTLMLEVTGKSGKIDAMQRMLDGFEIQELVRTGLIVLMRGEKQT
jgi:acetolactate synthase-1/3 small subunit